MSLLAEFRQRKLVQWAVAYVAFAFALLQGIDIVAQQFGWPDDVRRGITIALAIGFAIALILAWYHGERGMQRVTGTELIILALVLALGGGFLWRFAPRERASNAGAVSAVTAAAPSIEAMAIPAKSVAVLPFLNMSGDAKNDYFSDGITEEILDALAQIPDLKVAARTSAFAFKGKAEDLRKVGEALGVANVLEGSVQRSGDAVRITAQLIDVHSGFHLWSEKYDRQQANLFSVEDEISKAIADRLKVQFGGEQALVTQKTANPRAHDFYLRALALMPARGVALREARANLEQAVALDPDYAEAWAALSFVHEMLPTYQLTDWRSARQAADAAARRAIALDPHSAHAQAARATLLRDDLQFAAADAAFRAALALSPGDSEIHDKYAQLLTVTGDNEHAIEQARLSAKQNPLGMHPHYLLGYVYENAHRFDEAVAELAHALQLQPDFADAHFDLALVYLVTGNFPAAEEHLRAGAKLAGEDPDVCTALIRAVVDPALRPEAIKHADAGGNCGRYDFYGMTQALWYAQLGAHDKAVDSVLYAIDHADPGELFWDLESLQSPGVDSIRNDPRFRAALDKLGLVHPPAAETAR